MDRELEFGLRDQGIVNLVVDSIFRVEEIGGRRGGQVYLMDHKWR